MLMGIIPIAARVGGVAEMVRGSPAEEYLFTPGDIDKFVDEIERFLSQSMDSIVDVGSRFGEAVLKNFDSEAMKRKLIEILSLDN
jgi:glycosyltransferase involved in cell wall biosynthesis